MRRLARPLMVVGTVLVVVGLSMAHASAHGYDYTSSPRFGWSLAYIGLFVLASYGAGLPDLPHARRAALLASLGSATVAAVGISVLQLLVGAPLLPRFVIIGTTAALVPYLVLLSALARDGASRDGQRDRVVAVAGLDEGTRLRDELDGQPERPAVLACVLSPDAAAGQPGRYPVIEAVRASGATALVLDRAAQVDESIVAQAAELHEAGVRIRTLSMFYDQWLGKLPLSELERVSLLFDIGELHRTRYGRVKRMLDVTGGGRRRARAGRRHPRRLAGQQGRQPGTARLPPDAGGQGRAGVRDPEVPDDDPVGRGRRHRLDHRGRPPDHPLRRLAAADPPRRAAPGGQHPPGRPVRSSAPGPSSPATSRSWRPRSPSTGCGTWSGPASPAGPR